MDDERYGIFAELADGATDIQKALFLELLKEDVITDQKQSRLSVLASFLTASMASVATFVVEMFLIAVQRKGGNSKPPMQLFCASSESNTSNLHLQRLIQSTEMDYDVLILESPIKRFQSRLADSGRIRTHWSRSIITDLQALMRFLGKPRELWSAILWTSAHRHIGFRSLIMTFVRLLRGMSISGFLKTRGVNRIVFSLSGNACTSMMELRLKGVTETIHWLHGVGLGFKFESFSDRTLVNNEYDYRYYSEAPSKLSGQALFFPDKTKDFSAPKCVKAVQTAVLYSNLIHPGNKHFERMGIEVERELLQMVSDKFSGKGLVMKPHPSSIPLLGDRLGTYMQFLEQFGFRLQTETDDFDSISTLYLSTVSTSFIDLIASGRCVFMYDKFADRSSGFQEQVIQTLRFRDAQSFNDALTLLDSTDKLISALKSFVVQSQSDTFRYLLGAEIQSNRN